MTNLEMLRAGIYGRQYSMTKEFGSKDERAIYVLGLINTPQWKAKRIYEKEKNVLGYSFTIYCVDVESVA